MSWIIRAILAVAVGAAVVAAPAVAEAAGGGYVKYYTVAAAYNGAPEDLAEIALRFLGSGERSGDVYNLNAGRKQPDGSSLTDPAKLRAGWVLVMPWDAIGAGIRYGVLPQGEPTPKPTVTKPATGAGGPGTALPSASAVPPPSPSVQCATSAAAGPKPDWALAKLAADKAWPKSRGKGQLVAVVDSGVDAGVPQLNGHVVAGTDIADNGGRGDVDCLGTGTSMAGLVVAQPTGDGGAAGVAPDATVVPIRVVSTEPRALPAQQAAAIAAAVAAGASVIALGQYVDLTDGQVAQAIIAASSRNVVVVVGAPAASAAPDRDAPAGDGILRVGGVDAGGHQPVAYRSGAVDVVAPAVDVNSLGIASTGTVAGSGTYLAVAFVAATVALVRAADPGLDAQQVGRRVRETADEVNGAKAPDARYGWGFVNPGVAVVAPHAGGTGSPAVSPASTYKATAAKAADSGGGSAWPMLFVVLALLGAGVFLIVWFLRRRGSDPEEDEPEWPDRGPRGAPAPRIPESFAPPRPPLQLPDLPPPLRPLSMPTPSEAALRAATTMAGSESHWTDDYREPGMIDADDDGTYDLGDDDHPYGDAVTVPRRDLERE